MDEDAENKAAFHMRMRARGVHDLAVLRAFELVPRQTFAPARHLDLAARDLALPIGCGQTLDEPWLIARMIVALEIAPTHRVLQVGAGTGYATAILAHLSADVVGCERYRSLALDAQARLDAIGLVNAVVRWADGRETQGLNEPFDRILVHGLVAEGIGGFVDRLGPGGLLVCARPVADGQSICRINRSAGGIEEVALHPCRMQPLAVGLASAL